jgi:zinc transport system substrate-binding protein
MYGSGLKKRIILSARARCWLALLAVITSASSCGSTPSTPSAHLKVVASVFPLAELARQVGGGRATVTDLTPTGVEPGNLQLNREQVAAIQSADVVLDVGGGFQPQLEQAAASAKAAVPVLSSIGGVDPRVWLDPVLTERVATLIGDALTRADPLGAAEYRRGVREVTAQLGAMDIDYRSSLADCARKDIITSQPAFGRLASRYALEEHAIADPTRLAPLVDLAKAKQLTTVFTEPFVSSTAAESLAHQAHLKLEVLDPIDGLTAAEQSRRATYLSLMTDNLAKLRSALACTTGTT